MARFEVRCECDPANCDNDNAMSCLRVTLIGVDKAKGQQMSDCTVRPVHLPSLPEPLFGQFPTAERTTVLPASEEATPPTLLVTALLSSSICVLFLPTYAHISLRPFVHVHLISELFVNQKKGIHIS